MITPYSKRLLIALCVVPLMVNAATAAPQNTSEKPCRQGCPLWWSEDWESFFSRPLGGERLNASTMSETEKHYLISIDLPGMDKKDIKIETSGNRLSVSGERKEESEGKETAKRSYAQFQQSYLLPADANLEAIEATSKNGVLTITVPKTGKKASKKIEIK